MELERAVLAVRRLAAAFPMAKLNADNVQAYAVRLAPYPDALADEAIERIITRLDRFPSIAALLNVVAELQTAAPDLDQAWREVNAAIQRFGKYGVPRRDDAGRLLGGYDPVRFSHPAIEEAVASMGWASLCDSDNEAADRAHFTKLYETAARRARRIVSEVAAPALAAGPSWRHSGAQDAEALGPVLMRQAIPERLEI